MATHTRRAFLNLEGFHSVAYALAKVGEEGCHLTIGDCNRQVCLDFDCWNEETASNALHKADLLLEIVKEFRQRLRKEIKRRRKRWEIGEEDEDLDL